MITEKRAWQLIRDAFKKSYNKQNNEACILYYRRPIGRFHSGMCPLVATLSDFGFISDKTFASMMSKIHKSMDKVNLGLYLYDVDETGRWQRVKYCEERIKQIEKHAKSKGVL